MSDLFAPPTKEELAMAPSQADLFAPPTKEELAMGVSQSAPPQQLPKEPYAEKALSLMNQAGRGILGAAGTVSNFVDAYNPAGAALRAAISAGQQSEGPSAWDAYKKQWGEDPAKAPTAKDIAVKAGLSPEASIPQPFITNPWAAEQAKLSPAGIAGGVIGASLDPLSYIPFEKIPGALLKGAAEIPAAIGRTVAPKVGRILADIPEANTARYLANSDRVGKMAGVSREDLQNKIDAGVSGVTADRDLTQQRMADTQGKLDDAYAAKLNDLKGKTASLPEAQNIMAAIDQEKSHLGSLSTQADDALVRSGATFHRDDLLGLIDQAGSSLGQDIVGKQAREAVSNLQSFRGAVAEMPEEIDATRIRNIMRQLRQDMDFDQRAGQFNSANNKIMQTVTGGMSKALKGASPEYSAYMQRMSDLAGVTEDMSKHFGTETSAIGALDALRNPGGAKSQVVEDAVNRYTAASGNKDVANTVAGIKSNRDLLARMKSGDLRSELFPDLYKELAERQAENQMASDATSQVDRLTPNRTQAIVAKQGGQNPSVLDRRALEGLQDTTGEDINQQIGDKGTLDSFNRDGTRGSRLALAGGALGGWLGHHLGGIEGGLAGASLGSQIGLGADKYAGQFFKGSLDAGVAAKNGADTVVDALLKQPEKLGKYQTLLKQSMNKGPKAFLLDHHMLMHNDPGYRQMVGGLNEQLQQPQTSAQADPGTKLQNQLAQNPGSFGQYAAPLQVAQQKGGNSFAVTHFVLSQTDPNYAMTVNGK